MMHMLSVCFVEVARCHLNGGMMSEMSDREARANAAARFLPMTDGGVAERPCVDIAGVQVYVYLSGGRLVVNVDTETVDPAHFDEFGRFLCDLRLDGEFMAVTNVRAPR